MFLLELSCLPKEFFDLRKTIKRRRLSMESQIRFTVKEWRQKICGKKSSEDLKKEKGAMNTADVYGRNRFTFFIDLRSMRDSDLHGSGLRLVNTKEGI